MGKGGRGNKSGAGQKQDENKGKGQGRGDKLDKSSVGEKAGTGRSPGEDQVKGINGGTEKTNGAGAESHRRQGPDGKMEPELRGEKVHDDTLKPLRRRARAFQRAAIALKMRVRGVPGIQPGIQPGI